VATGAAHHPAAGRRVSRRVRGIIPTDSAIATRVRIDHRDPWSKAVNSGSRWSPSGTPPVRLTFDDDTVTLDAGQRVTRRRRRKSLEAPASPATR